PECICTAHGIRRSQMPHALHPRPHCSRNRCIGCIWIPEEHLHCGVLSGEERWDKHPEFCEYDSADRRERSALKRQRCPCGIEEANVTSVCVCHRTERTVTGKPDVHWHIPD